MESWYAYESCFGGHRSFRFYCGLFVRPAQFFFGLFVSVVPVHALEGVTAFVFCCLSGRLYCLHYFLDSGGQFIARAFTLSLSYKKAPGPSATEGRCFTRGDWRSTWFAERQVGYWYPGWYAAWYVGGYSSWYRYFWAYALVWNAGCLGSRRKLSPNASGCPGQRPPGLD